MKTRINPRIDSKLITVMKQHVKCTNLNESQFISLAIADKLKIALDENYSISNKNYAEIQIKEINDCINKLNEKKKELKKQINEDVME